MHSEEEISIRREHITLSKRMTSILPQSSWARQAGASAKANGSRMRVSEAILHQWSASPSLACSFSME